MTKGCFIFMIICLCLFNGCTSSVQNKKASDYSVVIRNENGKFKLYRNGKPYFIKGAAGFTHLNLLHNSGANTIRIWDTVGLEKILDEAEKNKLAVVVGLPLPESRFLNEYYRKPSYVQKTYNDYRKLVLRFRKHPALLMWCMGNELEFPYKPNYAVFYQAFNRLTKMVHTLDPNHPVLTTMVNFSRKNIINIKWRTDVDLIAFNTFGELKNLKKEIDAFSWFWNGPYMVTEWGIEGPWAGNPTTSWGAYIENSSSKKAEQYGSFYQKYIPKNDNRFLGDFVFYWGEKQEGTNTWFSMIDREGRASESVRTMQNIWIHKTNLPPAPPLNYMLLNEKGAADDLIFAAGQTVSARLVINGREKFICRWEIQPEDWYEKNGLRNQKWLVPVAVPGLDSANDHVNFRMPEKEGPYRLFAYVYNNTGGFAACNTPFYVIAKK